MPLMRFCRWRHFLDGLELRRRTKTDNEEKIVCVSYLHLSLTTALKAQGL